MSLWQDLRLAVRLLAKDKWFTAVAALALALGIGVNTTVFTFANARRPARSAVHRSRLDCVDRHDRHVRAAARCVASRLPRLGQRPQLGRDFSTADDTPGAEPVVILSDSARKSRYAAGRAMLGRTIKINDRVCAMPPEMKFPFNNDMWLPFAMLPPVFQQAKRSVRPRPRRSSQCWHGTTPTRTKTSERRSYATTTASPARKSS